MELAQLRRKVPRENINEWNSNNIGEVTQPWRSCETNNTTGGGGW